MLPYGCCVGPDLVFSVTFADRAMAGCAWTVVVSNGWIACNCSFNSAHFRICCHQLCVCWHIGGSHVASLRQPGVILPEAFVSAAIDHCLSVCFSRRADFPYLVCNSPARFRGHTFSSAFADELLVASGCAARETHADSTSANGDEGEWGYPGDDASPTGGFSKPSDDDSDSQSELSDGMRATNSGAVLRPVARRVVQALPALISIVAQRDQLSRLSEVKSELVNFLHYGPDDAGNNMCLKKGQLDCDTLMCLIQLAHPDEKIDLQKSLRACTAVSCSLSFTSMSVAFHVTTNLLLSSCSQEIG
jgi:hypothetical protein